jgi:hypothetical protein
MKKYGRQLVQHQTMKIVPGIIDAETNEIKDGKPFSMYVAKEQ